MAPAVHAGDAPSADAPPAVDARYTLATRSVPEYVERDARGSAVWSAVQSFYRQRDYALAWVAAGRVSPEGTAIARLAADAAADGLDGNDALAATGPRAVATAFDGASASDADAIRDVQLTYVFLKYAADLSGRFDPKEAGPFWLTRPPQADLAPWLEQALRAGRVVEAFVALSPDHPGYAGLKDALVRYRKIERAGGWTPLPPGLSLRRGSRSPHLATLRARLVAEGDLRASSTAGAPGVYDAALVEALKSFERRHGLLPDGALGAATVAALNVPVQERIRQIELNLERWRWLPRNLGRRYVVVNVPSFDLGGWEDGRRALAMRVVTGKPDSPTPVFSDDMTTVVFSPYWNVPPTIAQDEIIPAVLRDPGYLGRNNLELVRGTQVVGRAALLRGDVQIRQRPGSRNSLGLVKFVFPNPFNVYLHDTNADALFARPGRAFSHGCIRVEKPFELARWVLSGLAPWTPAAIRAAMQSGRERQLALPEPIPVYITYQTVTAGSDGVFFWPDVYGHDRMQMPLLPRPSAPPLPGPSIAGEVGRPAETAPATVN